MRPQAVHDQTRKRSAAEPSPIKALRRNRPDLDPAQRTVCTGNWTLDLKSNVFTASEEMSRIFRCDETTIAMSEWIHFVHPEDRARVGKALRETSVKGAPCDIAFRILRTDGKTRTLSIQGALIRDAAGTPVAIAGTGADITQRRVNKGKPRPKG